MKNLKYFISIIIYIVVSQTPTLAAENGQAKVVRKDTTGTTAIKTEESRPKIRADIHFKGIKIGSSLTMDQVHLPVFPRGSSLSILAFGKLAGVKAIYFTLDKAAEELYTEPLRLNGKGKHSVRIHAIDLLGNEVAEQISFIVVE